MEERGRKEAFLFSLNLEDPNAVDSNKRKKAYDGSLRKRGQKRLGSKLDDREMKRTEGAIVNRGAAWYLIASLSGIYEILFDDCSGRSVDVMNV
jgi:hypothetical protein